MSTFPRKFTSNWGEFAKANPALAEQLHDTALRFCEAMTGPTSVDQVETMRATDGFEDLRKIVLEHKSNLGIEEGSDRELALWIRTICYCSTMSAEKTTA